MITKECKVLILGYEDLNKNLRNSLKEEKVSSNVRFEVDLNDFSSHIRKSISKYEIVIFKYGINKQVLKCRF